MTTFLRDVRYAVRKLLSTPGFTVVTLITLSVAIGATTSMFSVVNSILLKPLPFADPAGLAFIESTDPSGQPMPLSPQDLADYGKGSTAFTAIAAVDGGKSANLDRTNAAAARLNEARVGADFFSILGVRPALGRFFAPGEDSLSSPKVAVLSQMAWAKYFGGDTRVIGQSIVLDGKAFRVVGIAPPTLTYPGNPEIWIPAAWQSYEIGERARGYHSVTAIGRLAPGATTESAARQLQTIAARLAREHPEYNAKVGAFVNSLQEQIVGDVGQALWPMLGAVAFVLLIACTNVANLLLVRAAGRAPEIAVRSALGADRAGIVRQLVVESLVLAAGGAVLGTLVALWILSALATLGPRSVPRIGEIAVDGRVLAFTVCVAIVTGLLFGLAPAIHAARSDTSALLRGGRGSSGGTRRVRSTLVVAETALSMVLLVGAGLLMRSFDRLTRVDPGFRANHLVVFNTALSNHKYDYENAVIQFASDVRSRLSALPGVQAVAVAADRPFDPEPQFGASTSFTIEGDPKPQQGTEPESRILPVTPSFFTTLGVTLKRGRAFDETENRLAALPVVVVNEALAKRYFPGRDPIGKHLTFGLSHNTTPDPADTVRLRGEVIGVVKDVTNSALGAVPGPAAYFPYNAAPFAATFVARVTGDPSLVEGAAYRIVHDVDASAAVYEVGTMDDAMSATVAQPRFYTILLGAFAGVALLLATLGIFGVVSYSVRQRTREFGIRIALGAQAERVAGGVVRGGLQLAFVGIVAGAIGAGVMTRAIRGMLFGTDPLDVATYVGVGALLVGVAAVAAWLPARQAARVDPVIAMKAE
ncbi:MAG: ABC transporter permease [Gemmatimonadales bacterium]